MESLGIQEVVTGPVCDRFASTLQVKNGRYELSLPWREYHEHLPDNCRRRLRGLLKRLQQSLEVLREYDNIIR